jgi:hypothetical protein
MLQFELEYPVRSGPAFWSSGFGVIGTSVIILTDNASGNHYSLQDNCGTANRLGDHRFLQIQYNSQLTNYSSTRRNVVWLLTRKSITYKYVRFEVFTAVSMKNCVFWDVTPCGSCKNLRFGGTWRLLHQGDKNRCTRNNTSCN